jgi:hypothetical protein
LRVLLVDKFRPSPSCFMGKIVARAHPSGNTDQPGVLQTFPNPALKLTRYGRPCKLGLRQSHYRRGPGLQSLPTRAASLERSASHETPAGLHPPDVSSL